MMLPEAVCNAHHRYPAKRLSALTVIFLRHKSRSLSTLWGFLTHHTEAGESLPLAGGSELPEERWRRLLFAFRQQHTGLGETQAGRRNAVYEEEY